MTKHVGPHFVGEFSARGESRTCPACREEREHGGSLIRDDLIPEIERWLSGPVNMYQRHLPPAPPPTRRQRLRLRVTKARWGLHDRMFPNCTADDYR